MLRLKNIMRKSLLAVAAFICLSASLSYADPITYNFTGTVTGVATEIMGGNTPYGFLVGQTLTGSFTYDTNAVSPPPWTQTASSGTWSNNYNALTAFSITVGSYSANDPIFYHNVANIIQVLNGTDAQYQPSHEWDEFIAAAPLVGPLINDYPPIIALFIYTPFSDTVLAHVGDLGSAQIDWSKSSWYLAFSQGGGDPRLDGTFTSINAVPVPIPILLLASGLIGLAGVRRFKK